MLTTWRKLMTFPLPAYAASTSRNAGSDSLKRPLICREAAPAALGTDSCNSVPPGRLSNSFVSKQTKETNQINIRLDNRVFALVSTLVEVVLRPGVTVIAHLKEMPRFICGGKMSPGSVVPTLESSALAWKKGLPIALGAL